MTTELHSIETQQVKHDREGSSKLVNLTQAMSHIKQTCAQLSDENEYLKDKERELLLKNETLEQERDVLLKKLSKISLHREDIVNEPDKNCGPRPLACTTTVKPIPTETEVDTLLHENTKLKQELQCLQTNFQLTSTKCLQVKKEMKELEKALIELQTQHDCVLDEKENIEKEFNKTKSAFTANSELKQTTTEKNEQLSKEVALLQDQLEGLQCQNLELQAKLQKELQQSLESQDTIERLDVRFKSLSEDKAQVEKELALTQTKLQKVQDELSALLSVKSQHQSLEQQASEAITGYKHKMTLLKSEKEELRNKLQLASKSLDDAMVDIQELEQREAMQLKKITAIRAENETLHKQIGEHVNLPNEMQLLHVKLAEFSEQVEDIKTQKVTLEEAKEKADNTVQELSKSNKKLSQEATNYMELAKNLQRELEKMETSMVECRESIGEKEREQVKQSREIGNLKLQLSSTENQKATYEAEVDRLLRKLDEAEQCNFELGTKLNDIESESNCAKLSKNESEVIVVELQNKLQLLEGAVLERDSVITDLKCASELMESENATLVSQVTSLSEMVAARNCKVDALNSQLSMYEFDTRDIVEKVTELETSHSQCAVKINGLEDQVCRLKESLETAQSTERDAETTILSLKLKIMKLQESKSGLEAIISHIEEDRESKSAQSEETATQNAELEFRLHDLKQKLSDKDMSLRSAHEEIDFLKKSKSDIEHSLKTSSDILDEKCKDLTAQLDAAEQKKVELMSRTTELEMELQQEKHKSLTVIVERDSASEQLSFIQTDLNTVKDQLIMVKADLRSTKSALSYQEQKVSETQSEKKLIQDELETVTEQYDSLRESALSMLEQSAPQKDENADYISNSKKLKGILKNSKALKSVENIP